MRTHAFAPISIGGPMPVPISHLQCALCSSETTRIKIHTTRDLYDVECSSCGRYRTRTLAETFFRFATAAQQARAVRSVRAANERGQFIRLGSLEEFPLTEWGDSINDARRSSVPITP